MKSKAVYVDPNKPVFVEVTEFRAISSDKRQYMVMRRNKKTDKDTGKPIGGYTEWVSYSYHGTFGGAAASLETELQRTCGAQTFTELRRIAERIHELMLETLDAGTLPSVSK